MLSYRFAGNIPNEQILDFYKNNNIDCFVMTSEHEGLPVSIMEAESAGIPIVTTNVGGIKEMIRDNGVLLSPEASYQDVGEAIVKVLRSSAQEKLSMRQKSLSIWNESFDAEKNSKEFYNFLVKKAGGSLKDIIFITEGFPYNNSEKSFLFKELKEMLRHCNVTIIARISGKLGEDEQKMAKENIKEMLEGCERSKKLQVYAYEESWSIVKNVHNYVKYFTDTRIREEINDIVKSKKKVMIRLWESIKYYCKAQNFYSWLRSSIISNASFSSDTIIYSYWNLHPMLGVCLNREDFPETKVITRAHGYDYQDEQWPKSLRKPFMKVIDNLIDSIVFVSKTGVDYHINRNGSKDHLDKYSCHYIGSNCAGRDIVINEIPHEKYTIVSCASMVPLKRIDLIIYALKYIGDKCKELDIEWIHFGDGELREALEKKAELLKGM